MRPHPSSSRDTRKPPYSDSLSAESAGFPRWPPCHPTRASRHTAGFPRIPTLSGSASGAPDPPCADSQTCPSHGTAHTGSPAPRRDIFCAPHLPAYISPRAPASSRRPSPVRKTAPCCRTTRSQIHPDTGLLHTASSTASSPPAKMRHTSQDHSEDILPHSFAGSRPCHNSCSATLRPSNGH